MNFTELPPEVADALGITQQRRRSVKSAEELQRSVRHSQRVAEATIARELTRQKLYTDVLELVQKSADVARFVDLTARLANLDREMPNPEPVDDLHQSCADPECPRCGEGNKVRG